MSAQRLSAKKTGRLSTITGLPVIRAWTHGGYIFDFVTQGHLHGWFDIKTDDWGIETDDITHYNTCYPASPSAGDDAMFPDGVPELTEAERIALYAWPRPQPRDRVYLM